MWLRTLIQIEFSPLHYNHRHKHAAAAQNHHQYNQAAPQQLSLRWMLVTANYSNPCCSAGKGWLSIAIRQVGEVSPIALLMLVGVERFNCPVFTRIPSPLCLLLPRGAMCPVKKHPCKKPTYCYAEVMSSLLHLPQTSRAKDPQSKLLQCTALHIGTQGLMPQHPSNLWSRCCGYSIPFILNVKSAQRLAVGRLS